MKELKISVIDSEKDLTALKETLTISHIEAQEIRAIIASDMDLIALKNHFLSPLNHENYVKFIDLMKENRTNMLILALDEYIQILKKAGTDVKELRAISNILGCDTLMIAFRSLCRYEECEL